MRSDESVAKSEPISIFVKGHNGKRVTVFLHTFKTSILFLHLSSFTVFFSFLFFSFPFIYSFVPSFYFYFWPMYSLNMFMTHSKRILCLRLRFVSGSRKFRYTSHTARAFQKLTRGFLKSFLLFRFTYFGSSASFDYKGVLNECVIREWTFLFFSFFFF